MKALVLVDIQNDFMPFGALPVADGDAVVATANELMPQFKFVVATQDWHPVGHASFASNHPGSAPGDTAEIDGRPQVLWPDHCVQNSPGASFHSALDIGGIHHVVRKGTDPHVDSYSGLFDNYHLKATGMEGILRDAGVASIVVMGLATDFCVRFTVLDALDLGFGVEVVEHGCRAVDLQPGDGRAALREMESGGARIVSSENMRP